jgi:hypothetical protein
MTVTLAAIHYGLINLSRCVDKVLLESSLSLLIFMSDLEAAAFKFVFRLPVPSGLGGRVPLKVSRRTTPSQQLTNAAFQISTNAALSAIRMVGFGSMPFMPSLTANYCRPVALLHCTAVPYHCQ